MSWYEKVMWVVAMLVLIGFAAFLWVSVFVVIGGLL